MFKFEEKFFERRECHVSSADARKGALIVLKLVWWKLLWWVPWELATTFLMYLPASDYHFKICKSIDANWDGMDEEVRTAVLDFLHWLDKKGEMSKILSSGGRTSYGR